MKRFMFFTIVLVVMASTSGCCRGLRLWGCRGAACQPQFGPVAPPPMAPPQYQQPPAFSAPVNCCPTECYVPDPGCGCATTGSDPAYSSMSSNGSIVSESPFQINPGEVFVGEGQMTTGPIPPNYLPSGMTPPANIAPTLPSAPSISNYGG